MRRMIALATALLTVSSCGTMRDSLILGAGSGVATGAAVGALSSSENRGGGALLGGVVGAAAGTIAAYFVHKSVEERDAKVRKDTLFNLEKFGASDVPAHNSLVPAISFNVVDEQKIETHRQGNKVIEGHRIWVLSEDSNVQYSGDSPSSKIKK